MTDRMMERSHILVGRFHKILGSANMEFETSIWRTQWEVPYSAYQLAEAFARIVAQCGGCELINDDPKKAPSKRITELFPGYKKGSGVNAHAYRIVQHIGLKRIRMQCPHFNDWMMRIEQLAGGAGDQA